MHMRGVNRSGATGAARAVVATSPKSANEETRLFCGGFLSSGALFTSKPGCQLPKRNSAILICRATMIWVPSTPEQISPSPVRLCLHHTGDALLLICAYDAKCRSTAGHKHRSNKPIKGCAVLRLRRWTKANIALWEQGFSALCKFRSREGHCCPPPDHVEGTFRLGVWVPNQRRRKALLPLGRERRLDAIGFI